MGMRRVLCLVLLIALGEAAVRYPRGYSVEGDLYYGHKNKNKAYYDLKAEDVTKGSKHIKGSEFGSNIDAEYQLLNKKENEIYNNDEPRVVLDNITVKDVEHSSTVESSDNIGSITLSRDSSIVSLPNSVLESSYSSNSDHSIDVKSSNNVLNDSIIVSDNSSAAESSSSGDVENSENVKNNDDNIVVKGSSSIVSLPISVLESSYSSNSDHSIDVKSSNNVPSDSIIGSDNISAAESSSSGDVENSESVKINDDHIVVKGSYSSDSEHINVKSSDSSGSFFATFLSFFISRDEHDDTAKSSSSSDELHISDVKSSDGQGSIINFLLSFFTKERYQGNSNESSSSSDSVHNTDVNISDNDSTTIEAELNYSTIGQEDSVIESSPSSEAEHSGDVKSDDISGSIIKTQLSDSITRQEATGVIESSSPSNAELISKVKNIYSNSHFLVRTAMRYLLNRYNDTDGSDIDLNDSDIPRIKILLSSLPTEHNQGDAIRSSSSNNNNEPIIKTLISVESNHNGVIENNYSNGASSQQVAVNKTQVSDITNKNDNLKIGNIRFGDANEKNKSNLSKNGDIHSSDSGSSSYGHSQGIIKDKDNHKNGHGIHHQTDDKGGSYHHGHVIPHKHSEKSSESSESSEESNESKDSHSREHDHDFEDSFKNSYHHYEDGHKITERSTERSGVNLKKSETKHKDERKVEEGIKTDVKELRIKRSGGYYQNNHGKHSEESGERYKYGYYRRGHGDSDSDSTSEESSEEKGWNKGNARRTDRVGSWGRRVRRSGGYYFGNGGYHYNSGESFDNSNEGGERGYYNNKRRPGFGSGFGQGSSESNEGY